MEAEAFARASRVLWRRVDGGVLLLGPADKDPIAVLGSTADVWDALVVPRTSDELIGLLCDRYREDRALVSDAVTELIEMLVQHQLIEVVPR